MKVVNKLSAGFTLIELLVVIGILGILASALVATIDPFEQLKKGSDAATQNTAVEFVNANVRFFTTKDKMPWGSSDAGNGGTGCVTGVTVLTAATLSNMTQCLNDLINLGELKAGFTTATNITKNILISGNGDGGDVAAGVTACFKPQSKSMGANANSRYSSTGTIIATGCKSQTSSSPTVCYWCSL